MYPLKRYFALISALSIATAAVLIAWLDYRIGIQRHTEFAKLRNIVFSDVLVNSIRLINPELFTADAEPIAIGSARHAVLGHEVAELLAGTDVTRLRIYNRLGIVLYSTEIADIGMNRDMHGAYLSALQGEVQSELLLGQERAGIEPEGTDVIETYVPVRVPPSPDIVGVIELYSDIGALNRGMRKSSYQLAGYTLAIMLVLYAVLYLFVRRASGILADQHRLLRRYVGDLSKAKEASEEASRAKSAFVANMSHEIRTPLNAVLGVTDLLGETGLTPRQRVHVATIRTSGDMLMALVDDILDFSRMEAQALELDSIEFEPPRIVQSVLSVLAQKAQDKGLEMAAGITEAAVGPVTGDPKRLLQILLNLVGNAVKFTDRGQVLVELAVREQEEIGDRVVLRFSVKDSGVGIAPDKLGTLFSPFQQGDASTTRRYGGTGLGLAISKGLADAMGGEISVESQPGQGSTFVLEVPCVRGDRSPAEGERYAGLRGRSLLLVAGNAALRQMLDEHAGQRGLRSDGAADFATALRALQGGDAGYELAVLVVDQVDDDFDQFVAELAADPGRLARVLVFVRPEDVDAATSSVALLELAGVRVYCLAKPILTPQIWEALDRGKRPAVSAAASVVAQEPGQITAGPLRFLVAEDVAVSRMMLIDMLESLGCTADSAADGEQAIEALRRHPYDCLLLDCQMPLVDGYEVARRVRGEDGLNRDTRIVAVTASATTEDRTRCLAAGMDDYLSKPVRLDQIRQLLSQVRRRDEVARPRRDRVSR